MQYRDLIYRIHARRSIFTRSISDECVEHILQNGEMIEDYPHTFPFPAKLLLGRCNGRTIHVVVNENSDSATYYTLTFITSRVEFLPG